MTAVPPSSSSAAPKWVSYLALILVLLLGVWQTCTHFYLKNDLSAWLKDHGGDGQYPPPPPPKF